MDILNNKLSNKFIFWWFQGYYDPGSWSCMAATTWFDLMYINLDLRWWNSVSDPCCPENTFSIRDECVGWSHIKRRLGNFGHDWCSPYVCIFWVLHGTHNWSFCESACCEAVFALWWSGFMIDSKLNATECMYCSHLTALQPWQSVSCASANLHRTWCSEMEMSPNKSW